MVWTLRSSDKNLVLGWSSFVGEQPSVDAILMISSLDQDAGCRLKKH
jgi:hypothetical protein